MYRYSLKRIWEVPINKKNSRPNRENTNFKKLELGLDPSKYHVLHVGYSILIKIKNIYLSLQKQTTYLQVQYHFYR